MHISGKTDVGLKRQTNQDAFFIRTLEDGAAVAVVCDGMGGANAGNVASETACEIISGYILNSYRSDMDNFELEKLLKNAIVSANLEVYDMSLKNDELKGMGTTVVLALARENSAVIAHVGDSRAYLAGEQLKLLTRDHSVVQSLIESGKITLEDAKVLPRKNVITRALGAEENVTPDCREVTLEENDVLLLCTDGLTGYADEADILKIIKNDALNSSVPLIELAKNGGGGDNITVVTITNRLA